MATTRTAVRPGTSGRAPPAHQGPLDGLRAAAAGAVLLTHVGGLTGYTLTGTPASWVLSRGDVGVPIFFSLSGLLLYRRWAAAALTGGRTGPVAVYLRRRALRILPAYWAVVLIALPVLNPGAARHAWPWIQYLLLVQNYDSHPWWSGTGATGLAQAWSLVVEASFYLVLPLLAAALTWFACRGTRAGDVSRRARRLLIGIAALAASSAGWEVLGYYPRPSLWSEGTLPPLLIWFCTGMAMAVALAWAAAEPGPAGPDGRAGRAGPDGRAGPGGTHAPAGRFCRSVATSAGMCGLIAACAFAIACTPLTGPEFAGVPGLWATEFKTALYALIAAAVVAPVAFQPLLAGHAAGMLSARLLGSRPARFLGKISYGIFLWQFLAAYAFFGLLQLRTVFAGGSYTPPEIAAIAVAIALLTIAAATVSYYLIERPAQHLRMSHGPVAGLGRWLASARIWLRADEGGGQPGDDDQADDLGNPVCQPERNRAVIPAQHEMLASHARDGGGQQQARRQPGTGDPGTGPPWPRRAEPGPAGARGGGQEPGRGDGQDGRSRVPAQPEPGER
ncbi:MAG: acyltransferase family protein [Streptosporangiaceae bacterium]